LRPTIKPLRTAILGCGHFAKRHAVILASQEDVNLVGFCDQALEQAALYNQQYAEGKAKVYNDFHEMFEELPLDLVYICLPPYAHSDEVKSACQHNVHFLIEKPIALTMEQAVAMAGWVSASKVKSQVGFMYRFGDAVTQLKQLSRDKGIAGPGFLTARYACNSLHSWWWKDRSKSGGQLVEQIIHLFDMARYLLGEPASVYSLQDNLFHRNIDGYTVEDVSATVIRFNNGSVAVISATNGAIPNRWDSDWQICLPGLTVNFSDANHALFNHTDSNAPATQFTSEKNCYLAETLDLLAAIREDRTPAVPIEEGVLSLNLVLAAAQAAEKGQPLAVTSPLAS
jgi:predicted dehydrogenase